jgi:hypothetical protein
MADLRPVYLGDALFSCQPMAEAVLASGADFLFVCKKDGHKTLYEFIEGAALDQHTVSERKPGKRTLAYHYRWIEAVPLRDGKDALSVNWLSVTISDEKGKVTYDGAFVTSLPITAENVVEIAACARARWKIENETFNVLKNNGYNLAHNFGHGKKYLARMFATMNLLAFAFHTACDCLETLWQQARQALGTRKGFFQDFHAICSYVVFACWKHLMETLITGKAAPPTQNRRYPPNAAHRWITRAGPIAAYWPSPSKCWVSLRRIAAARKQQVLRLGACAPLFSRTRPGNFPEGRRRKWISHAPPESRTIHASFRTAASARGLFNRWEPKAQAHTGFVRMRGATQQQTRCMVDRILSRSTYS